MISQVVGQQERAFHAVAALAFPFCYPGEEMVITAPENVHLQALTDKIETMYVNNRVPKKCLFVAFTESNTSRISKFFERCPYHGSYPST